MTDILLHVPDLETCKKLKDAGYPQETMFAWQEYSKETLLSAKVFLTGEYSTFPHNDVAAPLATEIMEMLPNKYAFSKCGGVNDNNDWTVFNCEDTDESETMDTNPATACALMWLRLKKDGKL